MFLLPQSQRFGTGEDHDIYEKTQTGERKGRLCVCVGVWGGEGGGSSTECTTVRNSWACFC